MEFGFLPVLPPWKEACLVPYYLLFMPLHPVVFKVVSSSYLRERRDPQVCLESWAPPGARARPGGPG